MPITYKKLLEKKAYATIHVDEDTLTTVYYPNRVTESALAKLSAARNTQEDNLAEVRALAELLCTLIASWDFYEDEEQTQMVPVTPERLETVSLPLLQAVSEAIQRDMRPEAKAP